MDLAAAEAAWHGRRPEGGVPDGCLPFIPYPLPQFRLLLEAALPLAPAGAFLDAGCGIGTKCLAAAARGLDTAGLEIVPAYIEQARRAGVTVIEADARTWDGYGGPWGIVYVNHPLAGDGPQAALEQRIQDQMPRGAVLISVNTIRRPPWPAVTEITPGDLVTVKP